MKTTHRNLSAPILATLFLASAWGCDADRAPTESTESAPPVIADRHVEFLVEEEPALEVERPEEASSPKEVSHTLTAIPGEEDDSKLLENSVVVGAEKSGLRSASREPIKKESGKKGKRARANRKVGSKLLAAGPLKDIFADDQHFDAKMNVAMSGEGADLVVGRGAGGMGMRGTSRGGGGDGYGRIGGLARVDTGGGRERGAVKNSRRPASPAPSVAQPAPEVPFEQAQGSEGYTNHGVNPMTETSKDRYSTFSIDVDTGAYTIARSKLKSNTMPPAASVRVEEFINYFSYNYGNPDSGAFGVNLEAAPSPFTADKERFVVRVGVQGKRIAAKDRKPVHLTFLVDTSGSMNRPNKLGLAKESLKILTRNLKPTDTVALTTYAGSTRVVLAPTSDRASILNALDNLTSGGGTAMGSGMELAYKQAMKSFKPGHVNRVIVLSDGDANIGRTSYDDMLKSIRSYVDEGVTMSTIGFGMGNYKDSLMEQLANKGNGNYYYIDDIKEARKVFGEQLDGTLEVIAKDVKIQVEFNPEVVKSYRLIGYENRDIADKDFRNDAVDAGEIGAGHSVTALYEVVMKPDHDGTLAYVRMRAKKPDGHKASEQIFMLSSADVAKSLADTSKDFQFATAVAGFAEILRGSEYAKALNYDLIIELAQAASSPSQKQRIEFIDLVQKAKALDKRASLSMR